MSWVTVGSGKESNSKKLISIYCWPSFLQPCVAGVREVSADHAASHVGKAEGVVTLLRATAYHRTKRNILLPMDIIERVSGP